MKKLRIRKLLGDRWRCRITLGLGWPRTLAWGSTTTVLALASLEGLRGGSYDPMLAVLTATVVAGTWAAYWGFRSVHPPGRVEVDLTVHSDSGRCPGSEPILILRPGVRNPTLRTIQVEVHLDVWLLEAGNEHYGESLSDYLGEDLSDCFEERLVPRKLELDPFYWGWTKPLLPPNDGFTAYLNLSKHLKCINPDDEHPVESVETRATVVRLWVAWNDDLCEPGKVGPKLWRLDLGKDVIQVVDPHAHLDLLYALELFESRYPNRGEIGPPD